LQGGRLSFEWDGLAAASEVVATCLPSAGGDLLRSRGWSRTDGGFKTTVGDLRVVLTVTPVASRLGLGIEVTATAAISIDRLGLALRPLIDAEVPGWWVYDGYQSWDPADVVPASTQSHPSWWTCALADRLGRGVAMAARTANRVATRFEFRGGELLAFACHPMSPVAGPIWVAGKGDSWRTEDLVIGAGEHVWALLGDLLERHSRPAQVPVGWLSWYHFGTWVSEEDVRANAAVLRDGPLKDLGYSLVQIDDGWQQNYGDWTANSKFGRDMAGIAGAITANGQVPGVWTAPFLVSASADLADSAPREWFVSDPTTGDRLIDPIHVSFGPMYVLDASVPAVQDHLSRVFEKLYADGFRYFKIDFLYAGGYPGLPALRSGVKVIRKAVRDSYLLGCGAPLLPLVEFVEGMRIGQDTATPLYDFETMAPLARIFGDEVIWIARNLACRHFQHRWYQLDPDVALVGGNLEEGQARQLATVAALSGGPFFASDDLLRLPPERLDLLRNPEVLALIGGAPATPDWEPDNDVLSGIWRRGTDVVAAFNWNGPPRRLVLEVESAGRLRDLWAQADIPTTTHLVELDLPAQGVRLLRWEGSRRLRAWLE